MQKKAKIKNQKCPLLGLPGQGDQENIQRSMVRNLFSPQTQTRLLRTEEMYADRREPPDMEQWTQESSISGWQCSFWVLIFTQPLNGCQIFLFAHTYPACPNTNMRNQLSCSNWKKWLKKIQVLKCLLQDQETIYHLDFESEHCKEETCSLW